jgi:hypothetical protein
VAGELVTAGAETEIKSERIFLVQNGRRRNWDEALAKAFPQMIQ